MIAKKLKNRLRPYLNNISGWRTNRKILVIESDDWGSIRMPSREVYEKCITAGYPVDQNPYERYDSLASEEDLELLFNLLSSFKDEYGNHPVFTSNAVVTNPDFEKIREFRFQQYFFESIQETFKKYPKHHRCMDLWKEGMDAGVFFPQFHGREHLNVSLFMEALQKQDPDMLFGFANGMPGSLSRSPRSGGNYFVEALHYTNQKDKKEKLKILLHGLELFRELFGYHSESVIPPNYIWSPDFDMVIAEKGVRYYQGRRKMKEPDYKGGFIMNRHYLGQKNSSGQTYLIRNSFFEPSISKGAVGDEVRKCLREISIAFKLKKPAVISSHRLNYIGFIDERNRDLNLRGLGELLSTVRKKWPDVEFLNTVQLGKSVEGRT